MLNCQTKRRWSYGLRRPFGMVPNRCRLAVFMVAVLTAAPSPGISQVVRGRVLDHVTDAPVSGAAVSLRAEGGVRGSAINTLADSAGYFTLTAPSPGRYRLHAQRIGYQPVTAPPVDLIADEPLDVELRMATSAVPLAPLTITAERSPLLSLRLENRGFYDRRSTWGKDGLGFGHFLDGEDIDKRIAFHITDLLRGMPGVHVTGSGRSYAVRLRSVTGMAGGRCIPTVYLDGMPISANDLNDLVSPSDLTGVEVYPGISASPGEFPPRQACGVIVLWTGP